MDIKKLELATKLQQYKKQYKYIYTKIVGEEIFVFKHPKIQDIEVFETIINSIQMTEKELYIFLQYNCLLEPKIEYKELLYLDYQKEIFLEVGETIFKSFNYDYDELDNILTEMPNKHTNSSIYLYVIELVKNQGYDHDKLMDKTIDEISEYWQLYKQLIRQAENKNTQDSRKEEQQEDFYKYKKEFEQNKEEFLKKLQNSR